MLYRSLLNSVSMDEELEVLLEVMVWHASRISGSCGMSITSKVTSVVVALGKLSKNLSSQKSRHLSPGN
jgi:hypothetical protein